MKKFSSYCIYITLAAFCTLFLFSKGNAQYEDELEDITGHWEASIIGGANAFFGDLGGNHGVGKPFIKDFNKSVTRPLYGISLNYFKYSWLSIKAPVAYTNVFGADSLISNSGDAERWRYYRNLSFRSKILEGSINAEVYPVAIFDKDVEVHTISPYLGLGIGLFHFNPQAYYQGQWIDLKPLRLEGEGFAEYPDRKPYKQLQLYIPATIGLKIYINNTFAASAGIIFRKTFTDYVDDIHTTYVDPALFDKYLTPAQAAIAKQLYSRSITPWKVKPGVFKANPNDNDSYTTLFLTLSVRFGGGARFYYGG